MTALIPRATPLEAALERATATSLALPAALIATTNDPWRCPADQLGFLAWQLSLELWDDRWPEIKKRQVCAAALSLHRSKTTLAGIAAHVALVGSTLTRAIRPPARSFMRAAMTPAERERWIASLPQLRVYPFLHGAIARSRSFLRAPRLVEVASGFDTVDWTFDRTAPRLDVSAPLHPVPIPRPIGRRPLGRHMVARRSRGAELLGQRVIFHDGGVDRPVVAQPIDDGIRYLVPAHSARAFAGHGFLGHLFQRTSTAAERTFTLKSGEGAGSFAVGAGLEPVQAGVDRIMGGRIAPRGRAFFGRRSRRFYQTSWAPFLIFDRIALVAPGAPRPAPGRSFHSHARFGMRPFTAQLGITVPLHRAATRFGRWHGRGFARGGDLRPLSRTLEAVRVAKALRDTVLIDTATQMSPAFRASLRFGDFTFGERMRIH